MNDEVWANSRRSATAIASMLVTGLWLALLISGVGGQLWLAVLIGGYAAIGPAVGWLSGSREWEASDEETDRSQEQNADHPSDEDALETLRNRYAAGELTDEQFENKLDRLLETESPETAVEWRELEKET